MQNPKENVSSRYITSLKSIKRNKPFNPFSDESCYILMLVMHSSQNSVLTIVQILASSEKHKINPMFFCLVVFFWVKGVGCCLFQAGLMLKSAVIELRELNLAIH